MISPAHDATHVELKYFYIDRLNEAEERYFDARETWQFAGKEGNTVGVCESLKRQMNYYGKQCRSFCQSALQYGMFSGDLYPENMPWLKDE